MEFGPIEKETDLRTTVAVLPEAAEVISEGNRVLVIERSPDEFNRIKDVLLTFLTPINKHNIRIEWVRDVAFLQDSFEGNYKDSELKGLTPFLAVVGKNLRQSDLAFDMDVDIDLGPINSIRNLCERHNVSLMRSESITPDSDELQRLFS